MAVLILVDVLREQAGVRNRNIIQSMRSQSLRAFRRIRSSRRVTWLGPPSRTKPSLKREDCTSNRRIPGCGVPVVVISILSDRDLDECPALGVIAIYLCWTFRPRVIRSQHTMTREHQKPTFRRHIRFIESHFPIFDI